MSQETILAEIATERSRQDALWGGPEHDDQHTPHDWAGYLEEGARRAMSRWVYHSAAAGRKELLQVAALAVAAIEALDRGGETDG